MTLLNYISITISLLVIINSINCAELDTSEESDKSNGKAESSDKESNKEDLTTISSIEKKLVDDVTANQEEKVKTHSKEEDEVYGTELPEKTGENSTDAENLKNFAYFLELFIKVKSEFEKGDGGKEVKPKSAEEIKQMKEETFELINKVNKKQGLPAASRKYFNKIWKQKEENEGENFSLLAEEVIDLLKDSEQLETTEENVTTEKEISEVTTEVSAHVTKPPREEAPKDTFAVRNAKEEICILAKFHCAITITYPGKDTELTVEVTVPASAHTKGKCDSSNRVLQISWEKFLFSLNFNKTLDDSWIVTLVELTYDTSEPLFDGAVNRGTITAMSKKVSLFETPMGKSYFCPALEKILLHHKGNHVATVQLKETHIQPYEVEDGKFSIDHRCNQVVIGGLDEEPFVQDETIPLAVGCTLALITLLILVGFSVHRAYNAAKVDYNSME